MCLDPVSVSLISLSTAAIGTGMSAYSSYAQGQAQSQIARNNARLSQQQATQAAEQGEIARMNQGVKNAQDLGAIRSSLGASGAALASGSFTDVLGTNAAAMAVNRNISQYNSALEAWGYKAQAQNYAAQAGMYSSAGTNNMIGTGISGAGSLLGGANEIAVKNKIWWAKP